MLVLTRIPGDEICIGDNVRVKIVEVRGETVRVGIDAPHNVRVDRAEVRDRPDYDPERKTVKPGQFSFRDKRTG